MGHLRLRSTTAADLHARPPNGPSYMRDTVIPLECVDRPDAARAWATSRFDQALLVLADLTPPLRSLASHWAAYDAKSQLFSGLGVRFEGFGQPVASIAAEGEAAFTALFGEVQGCAPTLVFVNRLQPVPPHIRANLESTDAWMVAPCVPHTEQPDPEVEPLKDASEVHDFVQRLGMHFWNPAMLRFGHAFGIRSPKGLLVSAACLNFALSDERYAHVGPIATDPAHRGKSMGTRVLDAVRSSLAAAGIQQCGVFASETDRPLVDFYASRGFAPRGQFRLLRFIGSRSMPDSTSHHC